MSKLPNTPEVRKPPEEYRLLFSRPILEQLEDRRFEIYCERLSAWREIARSIPDDGEVEAAADALHMEVNRRNATRSVRSGRVAA